MTTNDPATVTGEEEPAATKLRILLYSDHAETRAAVRGALGTRVAADLPEVEWLEVATLPAALTALEAGGLDLLLVDGETGKAGGMALARQARDELYDCPPILLLIARPQDAWLASWSEADVVVTQPIDPLGLAETVAGMLRVPA
jgi:CheY-like chemotaxis protein